MVFRALGKGGPAVSIIGFGAWPIGGGLGKVSRTAAIETVRAALDAGVTLVDTAEGYRSSESILGEALRNGYRQKCFLATKASRDFSRAGIRAALERSLRALRVERIDLYQIHNWDARYPIEASMEEIRKLREEGKVRCVGVSNFTAGQLEEAMKACPISSNQVRYSVLFREAEPETIPFCEKNGIAILAHSPLAKGLLTGRYSPSSTFPPDDERSGFPDFTGDLFARHLARAARLEQIAKARGISLVQLAIAWTLRLPTVSSTLVGAKTADQMRDHLGAVGVKLTPEEIESIEKALAG